MSESPLPQQKGMSFDKATKRMLCGSKVTRESWKDRDTYLVIDEQFLKIFKHDDGKLHNLIVSVSDLVAEDWMEC